MSARSSPPSSRRPRGSTSARAAAVRAEQERAERRRRLAVVGSVVAVVLAVVVGGYVFATVTDTTGDEGAVPSASAGTVDAGSADVPVAPADTYGLGVGDPDAPVRVEVFEDFLCPYCGEYEAGSRELLLAAAAAGEAHVVYRPMAILGDYSTRAMNAFGVVLEESGPEVALALHDRLFDQQPAEGGDLPDDDWLVEQAVAAGAEEAAVRPGIEDGAYEQWVANATDDASQRGVTGTPTVFVDGEAVTEVASVDELVTRTEELIAAGQ